MVNPGGASSSGAVAGECTAVSCVGTGLLLVGGTSLLPSDGTSSLLVGGTSLPGPDGGSPAFSPGRPPWERPGSRSARRRQPAVTARTAAAAVPTAATPSPQ